MSATSLKPIAIPLIRWFEKNQRNFPWRKDLHPYKVWLSEVMSQQTQMASVLPYHKKFLEKFPTIENLANADESSVLSLWTGLGYYTRARNLLKCARLIVGEFGGEFPKTYEKWLELPGIGPYTAAAISSLSFQEKAAVWDGNVLRVCSRLMAEKNSYDPKFRIQMLEQLNSAIQKVSSSSFNQGMMELGSQVCKRSKPLCTKCPIQKNCRAFALDRVEDFPGKKERKLKKNLKLSAFVFQNKKLEFFLVKRDPTKWFSGMWDFPSELGGNKIPKSKLDISLISKTKNKIKIGKIKHNITHHQIQLVGYLIRGVNANSIRMTHGRWFSLDEIFSEKYPIATTTKKLLRLVQQQC